MRPQVFERLYLAKEATEGTPVVPSKVLRGMSWMPEPDIPTAPVEVQGYSIPTDVQKFKEACGGRLTGALAVNELAYLLASLLETPAITTPGTNGTFTVDLDTPSSGTFTLTFGGQTTAALDYNITASALQTALEGLSSIGTGNVLVTGGPGETAAFTVKFRAALERTASLLTGDFASLVGGAAAAISTTAATNTRRWTYAPSATEPSTVETYTFGGGSSQGGARVAGAKISELGLTLRPRATCELTARHIGRVYEDGLRVQTVYLTGSPSGGTFTLTYGGQTTGNIAYDASAATVQAALEALSNIAPGDVLVVGASPCWVVSFPITGSFGETDVTALTADGASLSGGTDPDALIGNAVSGITETELAHALINPPTVDVYLGSSLLGLAKLDGENLLQATLAIPARHQGVFTLNSDDPSYSGTVERRSQPTLQIVVEDNTTTQAYMNRLRARDARYVRIVARGGSIETGFTYRLEITLAVKFRDPAPGEQDTLDVMQWTLQGVYDSALGSSIEVKLDTALTAVA